MRFRIVSVRGIPVAKRSALDAGVMLYLDVEFYTNAGMLVHRNDFVMQVARHKRTYTGPELAEGQLPDPADLVTEKRSRAEIRAEVGGNIRAYITRYQRRGDNRRDARDKRIAALAGDTDPDGTIADIAELVGVEVRE